MRTSLRTVAQGRLFSSRAILIREPRGSNRPATRPARAAAPGARRPGSRLPCPWSEAYKVFREPIGWAQPVRVLVSWRAGWDHVKVRPAGRLLLAGALGAVLGPPALLQAETVLIPVG